MAEGQSRGPGGKVSHDLTVSQATIWTFSQGSWKPQKA